MGMDWTTDNKVPNWVRRLQRREELHARGAQSNANRGVQLWISLNLLKCHTLTAASTPWARLLIPNALLIRQHNICIRNGSSLDIANFISLEAFAHSSDSAITHYKQIVMLFREFFANPANPSQQNGQGTLRDYPRSPPPPHTNPNPPPKASEALQKSDDIGLIKSVKS